MRWLKITEGQHETIAQAGQRPRCPGQADPDQPVVLRADGLFGQAAGGDP
jgi:hypothetical protein